MSRAELYDLLADLIMPASPGESYAAQAIAEEQRAFALSMLSDDDAESEVHYPESEMHYPTPRRAVRPRSVQRFKRKAKAIENTTTSETKSEEIIGQTPSAKALEVLCTPELVAQIIQCAIDDSEDDNQSLSNFALVNRVWHFAAIQPLYRCIRLCKSWDQAKRFLRTILTTTYLRSQVRFLKISNAYDLTSVETLLYLLPNLEVFELMSPPPANECSDMRMSMEFPGHSNLRMIKVDCSPPECSCCREQHMDWFYQSIIEGPDTKFPVTWPEVRVLHVQSLDQPQSVVADWLSKYRAPSLEMLCFNTRPEPNDYDSIDEDSIDQHDSGLDHEFVRLLNFVNDMVDQDESKSHLELLELSLQCNTESCEKVMQGLKLVNHPKLAIIVNWREYGTRWTYMCPPGQKDWLLVSPFNLLWNWGPISQHLRRANWSYWKIMLLGHHHQSCTLLKKAETGASRKEGKCTCSGEGYADEHLDTEGIVTEAEVKAALEEGKKKGAQAIREKFKSMEEWQGWRD